MLCLLKGSVCVWKDVGVDGVRIQKFVEEVSASGEDCVLNDASLLWVKKGKGCVTYNRLKNYFVKYFVLAVWLVVNWFKDLCIKIEKTDVK